jgi:hypothetical protein
LLANVPYFTTMSAALAAVSSLEAWALGDGLQVRSVQQQEAWRARLR